MKDAIGNEISVGDWIFHSKWMCGPISKFKTVTYSQYMGPEDQCLVLPFNFGYEPEKASVYHIPFGRKSIWKKTSEVVKITPSEELKKLYEERLKEHLAKKKAKVI